MYKYSKLTFKIFCAILIAIASCSLLIAFIYDPLQIWHKPYFRTQTYGSNTRETNKAIIRNTNFNSIIIGSSLSTNTSSKEVSKKLNATFMNLSMDGAPPAENKIILNYALKQKPIKKVVYFLGISYLGLKKENNTFPTAKYSFLYDNKKYNDYKIYLNDKYLNCIKTLSKSPECVGTKLNMDKPYAWDIYNYHMARFGGFDNWLANKNNGQISAVFDTILNTPQNIFAQKVSDKEQQSIKDYINENILSIVKQNPQTNFYLVIPPVSSLELARELRSNDELSFSRQKMALKYLTSQNKKYKNLKIYAFDNLKDIGDIKNFKDLIHFSPRINSYILDSIRKNKEVITSQNIDEYLNQTYQKAISYDFNYYYYKIKSVHGSNK